MGKLGMDIAVITGASSGIGKATAQFFAREGAAVVVVHHHHAGDADQVFAEIKAAGGRAVAIAADVRKDDDVDSVFEHAQ